MNKFMNKKRFLALGIAGVGSALMLSGGAIADALPDSNRTVPVALVLLGTFCLGLAGYKHIEAEVDENMLKSNKCKM